MFNIDNEPKIRDIFPLTREQIAQSCCVYRLFGVTVTTFSYIRADIAVTFDVDVEDVEIKYKDIKDKPYDFWDAYSCIRFVD